MIFPAPIISEQQVHTPRSLDEAVRFLAEHRDEGWRPLAGGTDLMVGVYRDHVGGNRWLNLSRLRPQLAGAGREADNIRIGALTTMAELRHSRLLAEACPLVGEAAAAVGSAQIQNRATVGGNIMNNSPAGDTLPVWLALDAELELVSTRGRRRIPYCQFLTGYRRTLLEPDELLTSVVISARRDGQSRFYFRKLAPRAAGISKLVFAAVAGLEGGRFCNVRLAFGCAGPTVLRARAAERSAEGQAPSLSLGATAAEQLASELSPIDDHRSTADYRLRVSKNLTREFLAGHLDLPPLQRNP
ncbi:MAG: FAD binding domain-containing protein [Deltaproteobacteria bacterium]